eukprot:TRINITY_DN3606_c0_g1_i1.p1 TRINITY_DN3606_c0_g1~~TRINITY_DN3606_c0_g1_i1.p1  ORF type:complete len:337 (-),score=57.48 TRINITY_DN3606_c0_g1_i1:137-1147(-)
MTRLFPCWESKKKKSTTTTRLLCLLCRQGDLEAVSELIKDFDVNEHNRFGRTPLHYACRSGNTEIIRLLQEAGAKMDALTRTSCSLAHECCRFNSAIALRYVLNVDRTLVWSVNTFGSLPIHVAAASGSCDCIRVLLEHATPLTNKNRRGMTPLHLACEGDRTDVALLLLTRDPWEQLRARDMYDSTPLHHACMNGMTDFVLQCYRLHHHNTFQLLRDPDCAGSSALDYAAKAGFHDIIALADGPPVASSPRGQASGSPLTDASALNPAGFANVQQQSHASSDASSSRAIIEWPEPVGDPMLVVATEQPQTTHTWNATETSQSPEPSPGDQPCVAM